MDKINVHLRSGQPTDMYNDYSSVKTTGFMTNKNVGTILKESFRLC